MSDPTPSQRVTREDLLTFVSACFACTGQREFYSDANRQALEIRFLHDYVLGNYRRLYARVLACGINHFNQAEIVFRLLASGRNVRDEDRAEENALVTRRDVPRTRPRRRPPGGGRPMKTKLELAGPPEELVVRLNNAGFGYLLRPDVLAAAARG